MARTLKLRTVDFNAAADATEINIKFQRITRTLLKGKTEKVLELIETFPDVNISLPEKDRLLSYIIARTSQKDALELTKLMIKKGLDLNAPINKKGDYALSLAFQTKNLELFTYLIEKGASLHILNEETREDILSNKGFAAPVSKNYSTRLEIEASFKAVIKFITDEDHTDLTPLKKYLDKIPDINNIAHGKHPVFYYALHQRNSERALCFTKILIEHGADINALIYGPDEKGPSVLYHALDQNHIDCFHYILDQGADINNGSNSVIHSVVSKVNLPILDIILEKRPESFKDIENKIYTTIKEYIDYPAYRVDKLIKLAGRVSKQSERVTDLFYKPSNSRENYLFQTINNEIYNDENTDHSKKTIKDFIENIPYKDMQDKDGKSPLHHAGKVNDTRLIFYFLDAGANPNVQDSDGYTLLDVLAENGHENRKLEEMLENYGADYHIFNSNRLKKSKKAPRFNPIKIKNPKP